MKKLTLILIAVSMNNIISAQWKIMPSIGISEMFATLGDYRPESNKYGLNDSKPGLHRSSNNFSSSNLKIGLKLKNEKFSVGIFIGNQLLTKRISKMYFIKERSYMISNSLGLGFDFRFRENKRIRPFIEINGFTEILTNYEGKTLYPKDFYPTEIYYSGLNQKELQINGYTYQSNPFIGNFLVGCDFRIYKGLSANFAIGYGLRILKMRYGMLTFYSEQSSSMPDKVEYIGSPFTINFNMLTLQLGLNYAFSFHKKDKKASE